MDFKDSRSMKAALMTAATISFAFYFTIMIFNKRKFNKEFKKLKILRENRKNEKKEKLLKISEYLNNNKMSDELVSEIIEKDIKGLLEYSKGDSHGCDKVLEAFQKKAYEAHSKFNCLVEFVNINKSEINSRGPLNGLPVSFKDNFLIKGYLSCAGCAHLIDRPVSTNSVLVDVIKDLGAVPYVKTNVPQTMMSTLSSNPIDGTTLNPFNIKMSPGGSSSGEAALISAKGSIVGIGTDIGGSVRLPAAFCGVVGFKPTVNRLSKKGVLELGVHSLVTGCCGILGRDVSSVACLFHHIVNSSLHRKLDPLVVPIDFNVQSYESTAKLKIGYFTFDGSFQVVPSIRRTVLEAVTRLKDQGHEVVEWSPPVNGETWLGLFLAAIAANKGKDITDLCQYDELDFSVKNLMSILNWNIFQYYYHMIRCTLTCNDDLKIWVTATRRLRTVNNISKLKSDIKLVRETFLKSLDELNIDVLLCPTSGFVALPVRPNGSTTGMLSYQNIWNLIDFPAGTVPVSHVTKDDIEEMIKSYPQKKSMWHRNTFENQRESLGLPVSVQCVSRPWCEELCLRVMRNIEGD